MSSTATSSCFEIFDRVSPDTTVAQAEVVTGEALKLHHAATIRSSVPVRWLATRYPSIKRELNNAIVLDANQPATRDSAQTLPANTPLSQPYWLREEHSIGLYHVDEPALIGQPANPPAFPVEQIFDVGGQTLVIPDEPVQVMPDRPEPQQRRRLTVIPPVSLKFASAVKLFAPGEARSVEVEVTAYRPGAKGALQLDAPAGWKIAPASQAFELKAAGDHAKFTFTVTAPNAAATAGITARAKIGVQPGSREGRRAPGGTGNSSS